MAALELAARKALAVAEAVTRRLVVMVLELRAVLVVLVPPTR
jgi:hypothetical protein